MIDLEFKFNPPSPFQRRGSRSAKPLAFHLLAYDRGLNDVRVFFAAHAVLAQSRFRKLLWNAYYFSRYSS